MKKTVILVFRFWSFTSSSWSYENVEVELGSEILTLGRVKMEMERLKNSSRHRGMNWAIHNVIRLDE